MVQNNTTKITFILGNGFDLNLGLHTKYVDMYENYTLKRTHESENLKTFKDTLRNNAYDTWSDFEMGMANYAQRFRQKMR